MIDVQDRIILKIPHWKSSDTLSIIDISPSPNRNIKNNSFFWPVSINEAGVDVVRPLHSSDWLQTHARGLIGHDVHQPVLELVAWQVGTHEPWCVSLGTGQTLEQKRNQYFTILLWLTAEETFTGLRRSVVGESRQNKENKEKKTGSDGNNEGWMD